jgi:hypothetical protein
MAPALSLPDLAAFAQLPFFANMQVTGEPYATPPEVRTVSDALRQPLTQSPAFYAVISRMYLGLTGMKERQNRSRIVTSADERRVDE